MALGYTKEDLEKISTRLQCCAVDAAKEALTAEMFLDHVKKECAWNKFKFIQKTSDVLANYIPGGMSTYKNPYEIINVISTNLDISPGIGFFLWDAITINDQLSPYYGFTFVLYGQAFFSDCFIFVLKEGEFFTLLGTIDYAPPYMTNLRTLAYDSHNDVLVAAGYNKIEKYNLAPLLNPTPSVPIPISTTVTSSILPQYSAYNRIDHCVYFSDGASSIVIKYDFISNFATSIDLSTVFPAAPSTTYVDVDGVTGTVWFVSGTSIYTVTPLPSGPPYIPNVPAFLTDLSTVVGINAVTIERISYSYQLNKFLVPYSANGLYGLYYDVALLNPDGSVYLPSLTYASNPLPIYHSIYYQQDSEYFLAFQDYVQTIVNSKYLGPIPEPRIILNEQKSGKIIVCSTFVPDMSGEPLTITVIDSTEEKESLCLNDDEVSTMLETVQHYCCDCCPSPTWPIEYSANDPFVPPSEVIPGTLRILYYGSSEDPGLYTDASAILAMTDINRYEVPGVYNIYNTDGQYIYFAVPTSMGLFSFLDNTTGMMVSMSLPGAPLTINGVSYNIFCSDTPYTANLSLKVY